MKRHRLSLKIPFAHLLLFLTTAISFPCFATDVEGPGLVSGWYRVVEQEWGQPVRLVSSSDSIYLDTVRSLIAEDFEGFEISPSLLSPDHYYLSMAITRRGREKLISMHALSEKTKIAFVAFKKVWQIEQVSNHISNPIFTITTTNLAERNCRSLIIDFDLTRKWPGLRTGLLRHQICHNKRKQLQSYRDTVNQVALQSGEIISYSLSNRSVDYQTASAILTVRFPDLAKNTWSDSIQFQLSEKGLEAIYNRERFSFTYTSINELPAILQQLPIQCGSQNQKLKDIIVKAGDFSVTTWPEIHRYWPSWTIKISNGDYFTTFEAGTGNRRQVKIILMQQSSQNACISLFAGFRRSKRMSNASLTYLTNVRYTSSNDSWPLFLPLNNSFRFYYKLSGKLRRKHSSPKLTDSLCN